VKAPVFFRPEKIHFDGFAYLLFYDCRLIIRHGGFGPKKNSILMQIFFSSLSAPNGQANKVTTG
jgi:hypothetical protein